MVNATPHPALLNRLVISASESNTTTTLAKEATTAVTEDPIETNGDPNGSEDVRDVIFPGALPVTGLSAEFLAPLAISLMLGRALVVKLPARPARCDSSNRVES